MAAKKSFVLRMDEETFKLLERWAADEFRSVNGQIEWIVDVALKESGRKKKKTPAKKTKKADAQDSGKPKPESFLLCTERLTKPCAAPYGPDG